jgi:hypothetical protein
VTQNDLIGAHRLQVPSSLTGQIGGYACRVQRDRLKHRRMDVLSRNRLDGRHDRSFLPPSVAMHAHVRGPYGLPGTRSARTDSGRRRSGIPPCGVYALVSGV